MTEERPNQTRTDVPTQAGKPTQNAATPTRKPEEGGPGPVQRVQSTARKGVQIGKIVILAALAVIATLFVLRNWDDVTLDFVFGDVELPLALVMVGSGLIGGAIGLLIYWLSFRKSS